MSGACSNGRSISWPDSKRMMQQDCECPVLPPVPACSPHCLSALKGSLTCCSNRRCACIQTEVLSCSYPLCLLCGIAGGCVDSLTHSSIHYLRVVIQFQECNTIQPQWSMHKCVSKCLCPCLELQGLAGIWHCTSTDTQQIPVPSFVPARLHCNLHHWQVGLLTTVTGIEWSLQLQ